MSSAHDDPALVRMVHAVLMPGFLGTEVPDWLARAVDGGLGSVLYFGQNLRRDPPSLSAHLHRLRADLLVASDEEGGRVTRLHAAAGSPYPAHAELGTIGDTAHTRMVAATMGRELRAAGIDAALAPVVDVNSDPRNPVIGPRAFGADAADVARHGAAFIGGLHDAGLLCAAKHFPGHGDTRTDSHLALPVIDLDRATLADRELVPFRAAVEAGADLVLMAHIRIPALDDAPASASPATYRLLREDLGFTGPAVTDALDMWAMAHHTGAADTCEGAARGAVAALAAGADLLCLGNPATSGHDDEALFRTVLGRLLDAVDSGALAPARLEEAAQRVAALAGGRQRVA
ncbi:beta-glucosidase-like glycosyl hydrolase [Murinocardiopsis flavida]|uniref:Beta-glucosidase-like glycosyl hydrolase n=1 Tax=Murinocardiopsis flavida TaxID=645275 RepID=A0A2P8DU41_9ACTN|nr:glycoside hydrolase family 3 N-terminal domain-containing protein [Murinocardiopsis flavida]PSL00725.1 beta-glucosidase-like glycosyl hydrolase [Murinocardiopsis flavida]